MLPICSFAHYNHSVPSQACGPLRSFKRLLTPIGKPQGFGYAEFESPDAMLRAIELLNGLELPSQEAGQPNKTLLVRLRSALPYYHERPLS
jgi:RNA recognition motif-containing protein